MQYLNSSSKFRWVKIFIESTIEYCHIFDVYISNVLNKRSIRRTNSYYIHQMMRSTEKQNIQDENVFSIRLISSESCFRWFLLQIEFNGLSHLQIWSETALHRSVFLRGWELTVVQTIALLREEETVLFGWPILRSLNACSSLEAWRNSKAHFCDFKATDRMIRE